MKPLAIAPRRESLKRPAPQTGPSAITHPLCFHYQALHRYYPEGPPKEPTPGVLSSAHLSSCRRGFRPD